MINLIRNQQAVQSALQQQTNIESPDAYLSLRKNANQAVTTGGIGVTWNVTTRSNLFASFPSGATAITLPCSGFYLISVNLRLSANVNNAVCRLFTNSQFVQVQTSIGDVDTNFIYGTFMRYFVTNEAFVINVVPSANVDIVANTEGSQIETVLHVVQLTRGAV
jgi:hypothetical protein